MHFRSGNRFIFHKQFPKVFFAWIIVNYIFFEKIWLNKYLALTKSINRLDFSTKDLNRENLLIALNNKTIHNCPRHSLIEQLYIPSTFSFSFKTDKTLFFCKDHRSRFSIFIVNRNRNPRIENRDPRTQC